jgi:hypothetical protein
MEAGLFPWNRTVTGVPERRDRQKKRHYLQSGCSIFQQSSLQFCSFILFAGNMQETNLRSNISSIDGMKQCQYHGIMANSNISSKTCDAGIKAPEDAFICQAQ